ncbi:MAG: GatB/YqeY domain-containing protein, partial [bacterium]
MNVQNKIKQDMVAAMKNKETEKLGLLRVVMGEFGRIDKKIDNQKAIKIIRNMYENARVAGNEFEMNVLSSYLPQMYSEEKVRALVANIIEAHGYKTMKDLGGVMKA